MEDTNIYVLVDPRDCSIFYIGKTVKSIEKRLKQHLHPVSLKKLSKKNNKIKSLLSKGLTPTIEILDIVENKDWIFWEKYWISQFKTWGFTLTNQTEGGDGVNNGTSWNKGLKMLQISEETRQKMSIAQTGLKRTYSKRKPLSKETKDKIGASNSKPHTKEQIEIFREGNRYRWKPVLQFSLDNKFIAEHESIATAAKLFNTTRGNITLVCKNKRKTCVNYIWKYKTLI